jgi:Cu+-exporting ATPase
MFGKAKDPVCGMKVSKKTATLTSQHMGKTFYFCSRACKDKFDQDPTKYMKMEEKAGGCCG